MKHRHYRFTALFLVFITVTFLSASLVIRGISEREADGEVINLAGRLRMHALRMMQEVSFLREGQGDETLLKQDMDRFAQILDGLISGDSGLGLPPATDARILSQCEAIRMLWQKGKKDIEAVKVDSARRREALGHVSSGNILLLEELEKLVAGMVTAEYPSSAIDLAGRQRMLTQIIAKEILLSVHDMRRENSTIAGFIASFEKTHRALTNGDETLGIPLPMAAGVLSQLQRIDALWTPFQKSVEDLMQSNGLLSEHIEAVKNDSPILLDGINALVDMLRERAKLKLKNLERTQGLAMLAVILTALVGWRLIVWPAQRRLEESESRFKSLVSHIPGVVYRCANDPQWTMEFISDGIQKLSGFPASEFIGNKVRSYASIIHPDDVEMVDRLVQEGVREKKSYALEYRIISKDGGFRWVFETGQGVFAKKGGLSHLDGVIFDITDRKRSEEDLSTLKNAIEQSVNMVVITDVDGAVEYANPAVKAHTLYSPEELMGRKTSVLKSGQHGPEFYKAMWDTIKSGEIWRSRVINKKKNGELYHEEMTISPIKNSRGKITHFVAIKQDVTEMIRKEEELRIARTAAENMALELRQTLKVSEELRADADQAREDAEKYARKALVASEAKSVFLSSMSHEFRTPLNAILGFSQLLESDVGEPLSASQRESVEQILRSGRHLLDLISDILDLSKVEAGKLAIYMEEVEVRGVLEEAMVMAESLAGKNRISMKMDGAKFEGVFVMADRLRLKQILVNFLTNAVKYNKTGGSVSVRLEEAQDQKAWRIAVEDTGIGISREKISGVFEPFNRLGVEGMNIEGTGIGLAIAKKLTEMMRGSIGMESEPGKGSKFFVELAKAGPPSEKKPEAELKTESILADHSRRGTILYVENNPANLKLVGNIMKRRPGVTLLTAALAGEGIEIARAQRPDLILMDIHLPDMDGFEALRRLRLDDKTKDIPVVALTASVMPEEMEKGLALGFREYIAKPINVNRFLKMVDGIFKA